METSVNLPPFLTDNLIYEGYEIMIKTNITKICIKCQVEKPVDEFSRNIREKDGFQNQCKACNILYRQSHKKEMSEIKKVYWKANKDKLLIKNRLYWQENKERMAEVNKDYRHKNAADLAEKQKVYWEKNKTQLTEKNRIYRQEHKDELTVKKNIYNRANKVALAEKARCYRQTPKGKALTYRHGVKRRALKRNAIIEDFNPVDVFKRDGYRCQLCGKKTRPDFKNPNHLLYPNLDHIIPLSDGGDHSMANTQCLCHQCNSAKYNTGKGDQLRMF